MDTTSSLEPILKYGDNDYTVLSVGNNHEPITNRVKRYVKMLDGEYVERASFNEVYEINLKPFTVQIKHGMVIKEINRSLIMLSTGNQRISSNISLCVLEILDIYTHNKVFSSIISELISFEISGSIVTIKFTKVGNSTNTLILNTETMGVQIKSIEGVEPECT